jgi:peptidoglycan/LPS O-acetylase OafA/YrhL
VAAGPAHARSQSLDTIRGIAILLVLIGHFLHAAPFAVAGVKAGVWVQDFGHGGVLLFFLLSGYLIWTTAQRAPARTFLLRRFAKIAPAYWVNVLFVAAMGALVWFFPRFGPTDILGNLAFLEGSLGVMPMSGVYWTLIVEVKFYLLFALVFYSPLRPLFWLVPFAAVAANLAAVAYLGRGSTFLTYLPAFFIGAGIAAMDRKLVPVWMLALIAAATVIGLGVGATHRGWPAAVFLAIDLALFLAIQRAAIEVRWLAWLGIVSYSVYLYHMTLGQPVLETFGPTAGWLWPLLLAGVTAAVLAASWLSYRFVETAGVAAGRRIEGLLSGQSGGGAVADQPPQRP